MCAFIPVPKEQTKKNIGSRPECLPCVKTELLIFFSAQAPAESSDVKS